MGLYERGLKYFLRLATPRPEPQMSHGHDVEEEGTQRKGFRRRIAKAVRRGHRRVMSRVKQPAAHGFERGHRGAR